ncbi:MAG: formate dehydrogenase subunit delta [Pseudomonadales bacterium]
MYGFSMSEHEVNRLVSMANEIAANIAPGKDPEAAELAVMAHLNKFWPPSLREKIVQNFEERIDGLHPIAAGAVRRLAVRRK